jgi:hypothetical protein
MVAIAVARSVVQYADVGSGRCLVGHHRDGRDLGCRHLRRYLAAGIAASSVARAVVETFSRKLRDLGTNLTPCRNTACSALPSHPPLQSRALRR